VFRLAGKARRIKLKITAGISGTYRHAGFYGYIPAVFSYVSHQVICRFAPCGTPPVAGFQAVAHTHTISAPVYRSRRLEELSPCWCPDGKKLIYFYSLFLF